MFSWLVSTPCPNSVHGTHARKIPTYCSVGPGKQRLLLGASRAWGGSYTQMVQRVYKRERSTAELSMKMMADWV